MILLLYYYNIMVLLLYYCGNDNTDEYNPTRNTTF